jgi:hypothetical protein
MKIGHFIPAYRETLAIQTAHGAIRDALWAQDNGHELLPFSWSVTGIDRARNKAIKDALSMECDLLYTCDNDVFARPPVSGLASLFAAWEREDRPAVVGAAVITRTHALNVNAQGDVGAAMLLIDLKQIATINPPYFVTLLSDDGTELACGEDFAFCRLLRANDLRVVLDTTTPTGHVAEQRLYFQPPEAVTPGTTRTSDAQTTLIKPRHGL